MKDIKKEITTAAQILNVLAENNCTIAEANSALHLVKSKIKETTTVQKKDYQSELTRDFQCLLH